MKVLSLDRRFNGCRHWGDVVQPSGVVYVGHRNRKCLFADYAGNIVCYRPVDGAVYITSSGVKELQTSYPCSFFVLPTKGNGGHTYKVEPYAAIYNNYVAYSGGMAKLFSHRIGGLHWVMEISPPQKIGQYWWNLQLSNCGKIFILAWG